MGPSPSSRAHTVGDPSDPTQLQRKALVAAPKKTTDPGLSAWGPRLFHRLTPLPRTQMSEADTGETTEPCTPPRDLQHPRALCTILPTRAKRPSSRRAQTTLAHHHHCQTKAGLDMLRLQGGHDARHRCRTPIKNWVFTPRIP
jgi:hypothetical protein